jgi:predicted ribosomally synthesized peptide with nif11-like leader
MSKEMATAFINKSEADSSLQKQLQALGEDDLNGLLRLASASGYPFSADDLKSVLMASTDTGDELDESQLDQVAGGLNPQPLPPRWAHTFVKLNPGLINGIILVSGRTH